MLSALSDISKLFVTTLRIDFLEVVLGCRIELAESLCIGVFWTYSAQLAILNATGARTYYGYLVKNHIMDK